MLDPKLKDWLSKGYAKIGDISYSIALNMRKGKNNTPSQRNLYEQGIKMYLLLDILFRGITFDSETELPILWRITEEQVNKFLRCLIKIGELDKYPVVPSLFPTVKPIIINKGVIGQTGEAGQDGSDATVDCIPDTGEEQISITEEVIAGVKTFKFKFTQYVMQILTAAIQGGKVFEVGTVQDITILVTSTKGTSDIVTLFSPDGAVDTILQGYVDLIQLNDVNDQPVGISLPITGQTTTKTYQFTENDGKNNVSASDTLSFFYPYLYGSGATTGGNPYTSLTKVIAGKSNKVFILNVNNEYAKIYYPSSYGTLTSIKDPSSLEAIGAFSTGLENVTSSGLTNNWTIEYRYYRTTLKTTIVNGQYQIFF